MGQHVHLARDEYLDQHPELAKLMQGSAGTQPLPQQEAEAILAVKFPKATAAIKAAREAKRQRVKEENDACAAKLGTSMDFVRELVGKMEADKHLLSWFMARINWTHTEGRPLEHDE